MGQDPALTVSKTLSLAPEEIRITYIHASGPGGQNVNKVASAAQLRFSVDDSPSLPDELKDRLRKIAGRRINRNGELIITARRFRSQARNRDDALRRLVTLVRRAARPPKTRVATRPSKASKQRRLDAKTRRGRLKSSRRKPDSFD